MKQFLKGEKLFRRQGNERMNGWSQKKGKREDLLRYRGQFGVMLLQFRRLKMKGYGDTGNNMANTVQHWDQRVRNCW